MREDEKVFLNMENVSHGVNTGRPIPWVNLIKNKDPKAQEYT